MATDIAAANKRLMEKRKHLSATPTNGNASESKPNWSLSDALALYDKNQAKLRASQPPLPPPRYQWPDEDVKFWKQARDFNPRNFGVRLAHAEATLADFTDAISSKFSRWQKGVVIVGAPGRGKTHLAAALLRIYALCGWSCRLALVGDILSELRSNYSRAGKEVRTEIEVVDELATIGCLVLDDLGREGSRDGQATDATLSVLHRILTRRIENERTTIVTSNWTLDQLEQRYDSAIASRLRSLDQVVMTGPDRRRP